MLSMIATLLLWAPITQAQPKPKDEECLACHSDPTLTTDVNGKKVSLTVDPAKMNASIHGGMFSCVDCHKDIKFSPHEKPPAKVTCAQCHAETQAAYQHSYHATARKPDGSAPATCADCHGDAHTILPATDPKSPIYHSNIPATCGACHGQKFLMESTGNSAQPFVSYQESVHGRAVEKGSQTAAVCTDCHGAHDILPANDAKSLINKFNVPQPVASATRGVQTAYVAEHPRPGHRPRQRPRARLHRLPRHPHHQGADRIRDSSVSDQNLSRDTCARCHQGVRLTQEFGVAGNRVVHLSGQLSRPRLEGRIRRRCQLFQLSRRPQHSAVQRSALHHQSREPRCHLRPVPQRRDAEVHAGQGPRRHQNGGGSSDQGTSRRSLDSLVLHPADLARHRRNVRCTTLSSGAPSLSPAAARRRAWVVRMTPSQRWQHLILLTSFFVLVVTGFALKYPDSWFAGLLGLGERWRSIIHRIAGVLLIADGIYHVLYVAFTADGRRLICDLFPTLKDATDAWGTMLYYLGFRKEKPKFGRFNYAEKAEYWALVWGTALMAVTGIMLWAKVSVGNMLARWWLDAATAVHFYEAILATLAILVWHFYQVFFDPDVYPMNWAWRDGKMSARALPRRT